MRLLIRLLPVVGLLALVAGVVLGLRRRAASDAALLAGSPTDPVSPMPGPVTGSVPPFGGDAPVPPVV
jgi:hypothetical protein